MEEKKRKVEVVAHNKQWADQFAQEADLLQGIFNELIVNIHHIGSTAVTGIAAKPIIDILIEVKDIQKVNQFNNAMVQAGYIAKGEYGIAGRRFFIKGTELERTHHVHIYEVGDVEVAKHVNFRDFLKSHPSRAVEYSRLKLKLAEEYPYDIEMYIAKKNVFFEDVEMDIIVWKKNIEKDLF